MKKLDLEQFPRSEAARRMLARVSPIYEKSYVGKWLFEAMGREMQEARDRFDELRLQAYPSTATWALRYWEQRYGIPVDETRLVSERRREIQYRRERKAPMNPDKLARLVSTACDGVSVRIIENIAPYTFKVVLAVLPRGLYESSIDAVVRRLKPSHQTYVISYEQTVSAERQAGGAFVWGRNFTMKQVN